eukprot:TRINITY_DN1728_c0_g2_i1.p1 TRINITY_DN1728_c0_g2~~TRINITY_DN1728_c0_g2_i1.p1  ORF type:complete len:573 (-),score=187.73 TRINITY_DN1728_c0_g2_i1:389-2107(-)
MAKFESLKVVSYPEGWGPTPGLDLAEVGLNLNVPLQDFEFPAMETFMAGRVGKVCDFSLAGQKWQEQRAAKGKGKHKGQVLAPAKKDEDGFALVDNRVSKVVGGRGRGFGGKGKGRSKGKFQANYQEGILGQKSKPFYGTNLQKNKKGKGKGKSQINQSYKEWSFSLKNEHNWNLMREIQLPALSKLQINAKEVKCEDLFWCGRLHAYNKEYDRITVKGEKHVKRFEDVTFFNVSAQHDPVLLEIMQEDEGITVVATHHVLSVLMAAARSVYSWDVVVTKIGGNKLFFDKRDDTIIDFLTVNETAREPPSAESPDSMNSPNNLSREATCINQNFSQMMLDYGQKPQPMDRENPFEEEGLNFAASGAFRYRKITLPGNPKDGNEFNAAPVSVAVQTAVNCANPDKRGSYISLKALNEFDPKANYSWRNSLETQRGAVLATELKNNAFKLGRWTAEAVLAGCDIMKIGYASRIRTNDPWSHSVLGVQTYNTDSFAEQIGMSRNNAFGILRNLIDIMMTYEDGKYLIMKDPTKPVLQIYSVAWDTFDEPEDDEEEEEEELHELDEDGNVVPDVAR